MAALVAGALALRPAGAQAATNTFQEAPGRDWNTAANWSQNSVPDATDDVVIPTGQHPILDSGADGVANSIDLDGTLTVQGTRTLTVGAGVSSFDNNVTVRDQGSKLRLNGTANFNAGFWSIGSQGSTGTAGGVLENAGTLNLTGNVSIANGFGGQGMLNLSGATINRTTSSGTASIQGLPFDNDGAVNVSSGTLAISGGSPSGQPSGGTFTAAAGSTLLFGGAGPVLSVSGTGSVGGPGTVRLDFGGLSLAATATYNPTSTVMRSGTLALAGTGATTTLDVDSSQGCCASIEGGGTLNVGNGSSRLDTVRIQGGTDVVFSSAATIAATGNVSVQDPGTTLRLNGTTTYSSAAGRSAGRGRHRIPAVWSRMPARSTSPATSTWEPTSTGSSPICPGRQSTARRARARRRFMCR